jgi:serine/threonine-protein kinase
MSEVYRARFADPAFPKPVCIKRVIPQLAGLPGFADMLRDEAAVAARLAHTNLVQPLGFGLVDGVLYLAMELVDGTSLRRLMEVLVDAGEAMPVPLALHIAVQMCRGLHHAHRATVDGRALDIVHRDVSPHNVLLGLDGSVKIGDFGIARATERLSRTATGQVKGKPQYMAPEQALSEPSDHRVDQFATGVVLWEMLAGRALFVGKSVMEVIDALTTSKPPALPSIRAEVPASVDAVVRKALARAPRARFPDMAVLEQALLDELRKLDAHPADIDTRPFVQRAVDAGPDDKTRPVGRRPERRPRDDTVEARSMPEQTARLAPASAPSDAAPPLHDESDAQEAAGFVDSAPFPWSRG